MSDEGVIDGQSYEAPHCNTEVLHAPGQCYYCDHYPDRQSARAASGGSFTPPEANGWSGNVAVKSGEIHEHMGARYRLPPPPIQWKTKLKEPTTMWTWAWATIKFVFTGKES